MVWLIVLTTLILLACIQVGIIANYNQEGAGLLLCIGPVRISLYPGKKGVKKDRQKKSDSGKGYAATAAATGEKQKGTFHDFLSIAQFAIEVLSDFRRKIRINDFQLKLILAGGDPCDLSVNYGRTWAALGALMPQLERCFVIRKRNIGVECDYLADTTQVRARIYITITIARLLFLVTRHGIRGLLKYYKIIEKIKGGATI